MFIPRISDWNKCRLCLVIVKDTTRIDYSYFAELQTQFDL